MPSNLYNGHFKNSHKTYVHAAYRHQADIPNKEFVSWDFSKLIWMLFVILLVLGIIFFT